MNIMVKMIDPAMRVELRKEFEKIDADKTGLLTKEELKKSIQNSGIKINSTEIEQIIHEIDYHHNNKINYSEFLAATIDMQDIHQDGLIEAIFNQFDTDSSGNITKENIITAFEKIGHLITNDELQEIMM